MIRWIFFDVGSTLVDETAAYDHRAQDMLVGTGISFEAFCQKRAAFAAQGLDGNAAAIKYFALSKTPWHAEDEAPFDDAVGTLQALKSRGYRLGVIANQLPGAAQRLAQWGLLPYFDALALSCELGAAKPSPEIFEKALAMARCGPQNAAMVGDRLDNDIVPAKALGLTTVWFSRHTPASAPLVPAARAADYRVCALRGLLSIF